MLTFLLGVAIVAGIVAAACAWQATGPRREERRQVLDLRDEVRYLHSGHIDNLPRTGGPPDPDDRP